MTAGKARTSPGFTDGAAMVLLGLWAFLALAALVFALLVGPERAMRPFQVADLGAWAAFGGAGLLTWLPRWSSGLDQEPEPIGPMRLWGAALLAALIVCLAGSALVGPRLRELTAFHGDPQALGRVHALACQFLGLRALLALGLLWGLPRLPRK